MSSMPSDPKPVTLELDLRPKTDQVGELHGQSSSLPVSDYLAISPPKSLFVFHVRSGLELHGYYNGKPATLITLTAHFEPKNQARPIKWAAITAYFASEKKGDKENAIKIEAFALGQPTVKVEFSVESDTLRTSAEGNAGVDYLASAGGKLGREHEVSKEIKYAATLSGSAYPTGVKGDTADTVRWILNGNQSQNSGIPPDLTFGIILLRANNANFVGYVQVDIEVDWKHKVAEWLTPFTSYKRWGKVARHKVYIPSEVAEDKAPENVVVEKMEELTKNGKATMEGLVKIEMPVDYGYLIGGNTEKTQSKSTQDTGELSNA